MLKSFLDNIKEQATRAVGRYKNRDFLQACMAASVMVAQADGVIEPSEKQKIFGYAKHNELLQVFDFEDVKKEFEKVSAAYEFDPDLGKQDTLHKLSQLTKSMNAEQRKCVMLVSCAVGKADGNFDDKEKATARDIRTALSLSSEDFPI
jgi:tellurite resistance protein TerB